MTQKKLGKDLQFFYFINIIFFYLCFLLEREALDIFYLWIINFTFYLLISYLIKKVKSISFKFTLFFLFFSIALTLPAYVGGITKLIPFFLNLLSILIVLFFFVKLYDYKLDHNYLLFKSPKKENSYNSNIYYFYIIFFIIILLPLNYWMFQNKIGITGIPSTKLILKLSGILSLFCKYLVPLIFFYLFLGTKKKSFTLSTIFFIYSLYLGCATGSRSASALMLGGPIIFYYFDKKWFKFLLTLILCAISYELITVSRELTYLHGAYGEITKSDNNLFFVISSSISKIDFYNIAKFPFFIGDRFLGIQSLINAHKSEVATDLNYIATWKVTVGWPYTDYFLTKLNLLDFEQSGRMPRGGTTTINLSFFYLTLISSKNALLGKFVFCLTYAIFTCIVDFGIKNIGKKYRLKKKYCDSYIVIVTLVFLLNPQYILNKISLFLIIFLYLIPKIIQLKRILKSINIGY